MSNPRNVNQMLQTSAATQAAKLPGIPAVQVADRAVSDVLKAMKERLEVREGERGNPFESTVTLRQMDELGLVRTTPAPCRVSELAGVVGQTKAGEFVTISLNDLAAALDDTKAGKIATVPTTSVNNAAEIEALRASMLSEAANIYATINTIKAPAAATYTPSVNMVMAEQSFSQTPEDVAFAGWPMLNENTVLYVDRTESPPKVYRGIDLFLWVAYVQFNLSQRGLLT